MQAQTESQSSCQSQREKKVQAPVPPPRKKRMMNSTLSVISEEEQDVQAQTELQSLCQSHRENKVQPPIPPPRRKYLCKPVPQQVLKVNVYMNEGVQSQLPIPPPRRKHRDPPPNSPLPLEVLPTTNRIHYHHKFLEISRFEGCISRRRNDSQSLWKLLMPSFFPEADEDPRDNHCNESPCPVRMIGSEER